VRTLATDCCSRCRDLYEFVHKYAVADKSMLASARISYTQLSLLKKTLHWLSYSKVTLRYQFFVAG
jgi:hypothetical protein